MKCTLTALLLLWIVGCGASDAGDQPQPKGPPPKPQLFGHGPRYFPKPSGANVRHAQAIKGMTCMRGEVPRYLAHLEIFIDRRVVLLPKGIGVSPRGCSYPLRTRQPTGIIEVAGAGTLGDLYAIWGRPLPPGARVYVGTRRLRGNARDVPLDPHSAITVETGRQVPPHANFVFP